jgi:hypothetical protein
MYLFLIYVPFKENSSLEHRVHVVSGVIDTAHRCSSATKFLKHKICITELLAQMLEKNHLVSSVVDIVHRRKEE